MTTARHHRPALVASILGPAMLVSAVLLSAVLLSAQQSRDTLKPAEGLQRTGTAAISGIVVVAGEQAEPIRRATVSIAEQAGASGVSVVTEADGRFTFSGLPAGRYFVTATKPAYLTTAYGASGPRRSSAAPTGTAIVLGDGQQMRDARLVMWRGGVITGVVRGQGGEPARGAAVSVMFVRRDATGTRQLANLGFDVTDSRGVYRIFGLPPGDYLVGAQWASATEMTDLEVTRDSDLSTAARLARLVPGGAPPPVPPVSRPRVGMVPTFHPAVLTPADATVVSLASGEERTGVDVRMELGRSIRVNGRVVDEAGVPRAGVRLTVSVDSAVMSFFAAAAVSGADGTFSLRGVPPGSYTLEALALAQPGGASPMWARTEVVTSDADVDAATLALRPAPLLTGRVQVPAGVALPPDLSRLRVLLNRATGTIPLSVAADGTIRGPVLPGRYRLSVQMAGAGGPREWFAVSARFGGSDVLDAGMDVPAAPALAELVIDLTNQVPEIAGSLTDGAGQPAPEYFVIVFPADRALWLWGSYRIRQVRPGSDGRFAFAALPPGDYLIGAVTDVEDNQWFEPEFLEQLAPASVKVTLGPGQRLVQNLRVR